MGRKKCNCACACARGKQQASDSSKRWNTEFSKRNRTVATIRDPLFVDVLERTGIQRPLLDAFLALSEISGSCWEVEQVQKFFREAGALPEGKIWMDYRTRDTEPHTRHSRWLLTNQLDEAMALRRSGQLSKTLPTRCLTFVPYASPSVLESTIKSATDKEAQTLRLVVCQYFGGETLIRVHTSVEGFEGFPVFRLILNLPFLSLEEAENEESEVQPGVDKHNKKIWESLPYLDLENENGDQSRRFVIYETRSTVVLSGRSNSDWYGYAIGNVGPVDTSTSDDEDDDAIGDETDESTHFDPENEPEPEEDFFATGGCEPVLNPESPIWDPRIYFLRTVEIRLMVMAQASEHLVRKIDAGCQDWIPEDSSTQEALKRMTGMTKVFRRLRKHFAQSLRAWDRFSGTGDAMYFADLRTHPIAREALSRIKKSFEKISDLENRVGLQETDCTAAVNILQANMTLQTNLTMAESNRLHLESVEASLKSLAVSRALSDMHLRSNAETSRHSENAAASAVKSLIIAEDMNSSTRVNVQLFSMTTAMMLALQYFCSDRALFAFDRSPRAFWIGTAILILAFLALSCILHAIDHLRKKYAKQISKKLKSIGVRSRNPQVE